MADPHSDYLKRAENYELLAEESARSSARCSISPDKQERGTLQQQLELLEAGKVRTGEDGGEGWIDTTGESISRIKRRLAELEELLTEAGSGTASRPGER